MGDDMDDPVIRKLKTVMAQASEDVEELERHVKEEGGVAIMVALVTANNETLMFTSARGHRHCLLGAITDLLLDYQKRSGE